MELTRKELENQIERTKALLESLKEGIAINEIVLHAFEEKLALMPAKEMLEEIEKSTPTSQSEESKTE